MRIRIQADLEGAFRSQISRYEAKIKAQEKVMEGLVTADDARSSLRQEIYGEIKKKCVAVENGGYFCLPEESAPSAFSAVSSTEYVFSAKDGKNGNQEIYLRGAQGVERITRSGNDNIFPVRDVSGEHLAWQGLIGGRWQIFFHDRPAGRTYQVTSGDSNNLYPQVQGNTIVWQGWIDGNWEIFFGRKSSDDQWAIGRITRDPGNDMFPKLAGDLVTWQSFDGNLWHIYVHDLSDGNTKELSSGPDKYEHPRLTVVWEEGTGAATRMRGYDLATGELTDLTGEKQSTKPFELPSLPLQDNKAVVANGAVSTTTKNNNDDGKKPSDL
jgi:beta propeller repeat protein